MIRMFIFLVFVTVGGLGYLFYVVSTSKHDVALWHVDPLTAPETVKPHSFRVARASDTTHSIDMTAPTYSANPTLMAKAFDDFVLRQSKTIRIAGSPEEGWMTYVQRTPSLNFPDYISVKFLDLQGGKSTIAVFSRSRYGYSDQGVNEARVKLWIGTLQSFEETPEVSQ